MSDVKTASNKMVWDPLVIVCDDNELIVDLIASKLEEAGCKTAVAYDGKTALELARTKNPEAMVLDIMMPELDGLDVLYQLKQDSKTKHIPLLIITSKKKKEDVLKGLLLGADEYLVKPFMPEELINRLKKQLVRRGITI